MKRVVAARAKPKVRASQVYLRRAEVQTRNISGHNGDGVTVERKRPSLLFVCQTWVCSGKSDCR
jgi:hypothetical protein